MPIAPANAGRNTGLARWLLLLLLLVQPYTLFVHSKYPVTVFGYSLWASALPAGIIVLVFMATRSWEGVGGQIVLASAGIAVVVSVARRVAYQIAFVNALNSLRWLFLVPMLLAAAGRLLAEPSIRRAGSRIIIANTLVGGFIGIAYYLNLISYRVLPTDPAILADTTNYIPLQFKTRASGLLASPNVFGNFLLLGILVICLTPRRNRYVLSLLGVGILVFGIITSGSRIAIAIGILAISVFLMRTSRAGYRGIVRLTTLVILLVALSGPILRTSQSIIGRFSGDQTGTAVAKSSLGSRAILSGPLSAVIGPRPEALFDESSKVSVSDNSWILIGVSGGLLVFFAFVGGARALLRPRHSRARGRYRRLYLAACLSVLTFNNALLWDVWIIYAVVGYWIVTYDEASAASNEGDGPGPDLVSVGRASVRSPRAQIGE